MPLIQEHQQSRFVYICGTNATLMGDWTKNKLRLFPHENREEIACDLDLSKEDGHGGADSLVVSAFLDWLDDPAKLPKTTGKDGYEAMLISCGIDLALKKHRVIELRKQEMKFSV